MDEKNKTVLAVGAHPDDVEFMCAGTLKLFKERGFDIYIGLATNGDCGSFVESPEIIAGVRIKEAEEAAKLLNAELFSVGERDLRLDFNDRTKMKMTEFIRSINPSIVFTHPHVDYSFDHEITSMLVRFACFAATIPNYFANEGKTKPVTSQVPHLYYCTPLEGKDLFGNLVKQQMYVDISVAIDFKSSMLACHKSQRDLLFELHNMDNYIATMKNTASVYGKLCGCLYAEGFNQHLGPTYPADNILKKVLKELVV
jgi:LmbE family N-acetylglucosaminyl deacetylase